jgi:hypothetical protein
MRLRQILLATHIESDQILMRGFLTIYGVTLVVPAGLSVDAYYSVLGTTNDLI